MKEIRLNKEQFKVFNDYDQFQIFTDEEGWSNYEDLNIEFEKLFKKYDTFIINEDDYIYGEKEGVRTLIISDASEAFLIADEVLND